MVYELASRYCHSDSDVLKNKLDLRDQKRLDRAESKLVTIRLAELYMRPIKGTFDLSHLQNFRHYIFITFILYQVNCGRN
ncbi:MAG: hypothetical protein FWJ66_03335 [Caldibacillus sp.]